MGAVSTRILLRTISGAPGRRTPQSVTVSCDAPIAARVALEADSLHALEVVMERLAHEASEPSPK